MKIDWEQIKKEYIDSNGEVVLKDLADKYGVKIGTLRSRKSREDWDKEIESNVATDNATQRKENKNVATQNKSKTIDGSKVISHATINKRLSNKTNSRHPNSRPGNKNALGNRGGSGAPIGNLNSIKHGAYQTIYADMLNEEDKELYEQIEPTINIDEEIRVIRLKIARLLNFKESFFYSPFGDKIKKEITEEERIAGINACIEQLRKLISTKASTLTDIEKLQLEKEKFEFQKYRTEIELQIKQEKLSLDKMKVSGDDGEVEDDGFIDALSGKLEQVWDDIDEEN